MVDSLSALIPSLASVFSVMATLFLISLIGFVAIRKGIVDDHAINALTRLLVDLVAPAKMVAAMMAGLDAESLAECAVVMLAMVVWTLMGVVWGWICTTIWRTKPADSRRDHAVWATASLQNGVFLALPMVLALVPKDLQTLATVHVGGAFVVMVATQWTLGVALLRGESAPQDNQSVVRSFIGILNPPLIAILIGAVLAFVPVFAAAGRGEPAPMPVKIVVDTTTVLGSALSPLAMIVLGMLVGKCHLSGTLNARGIGIPLLFRLVVSPAIMFLALTTGVLGWVSPVMGLVLMIQAASPPATTLSLIARRYGGDWQAVASVLLVTYGAALVTMPVWTAWAMERAGW